ncbi:MAG: hypothetical protein IJN49_00630 [Clostridia bacterium]|nr:hypothetical protein [Clostridia bacterium]
MSNFNSKTDNQEFIKKLELLCDLEAEKPVEEMDVSFVMACVELILELRGETVNLTPEEVEEKVRKIPFVEETTTLNTPPKSVKGRSTKVKSHKILLIAAIISILIAIFTTISVAFDWNIFDELKNRFGTVADTPVNEEMEINGITVFMYGEEKKYKTIELALQKENISVLYPTKFPENIILQQVSLYEHNSRNRLTFAFNDTNFVYYVVIDEKILEDTKNISTEVVNINGKECYITEMKDINITQIYFEYNRNLYYLSYNNKQDLINVIENLKELQ